MLIDRQPAWDEIADATCLKLRELLGADLIGAYVHGSTALGGWVRTSDVDILAIVDDQADHDWNALGREVADCGQRVPLEMSIVRAVDAQTPSSPWPYVVHVATDAGRQPSLVIVGTVGTGDADLVLHYLVVRTYGRTLHGPAPSTLVGAVPRGQVFDQLRAELQWGLLHGDEKYAVLNACRAHAYAADGLILSKIDGAEWARPHATDFTSLIDRAVAAQRCGALLGPATEQTHHLVRTVTTILDQKQ